jgi:predicted nucleic acid-binding protein
MKVLLDLNVLLDVVQARAPHYRDSAKILSLARLGEIQAVLPVHAFTTLYYVLAKAAGRPKADQTIDWLLAHFDVAVADKAVLRRARRLPMADFEDAVVASSAEAGQCDYVVTRNVSDFAGSPVPALTPTDFLIRGRFID